MSLRRRPWLLLLAPAWSCQQRAVSKPAPLHIESCSYGVRLAASGEVQVLATCRANGAISFRSGSAELSASVRGASAKSGHFSAPQGQLSYSIALGELSDVNSDFDRAARVGASFVAPLSTVLLVPEPLTTEIPVTLRIEAPAGVDVAVGLKRDAATGAYRLMAHEIPVATYFSFGKLEQRTLEVARGRLELNQLDGALAPSFDELSRWIGVSASAVSDFYGAFPVPRASVTVIPVPDRDAVVFGKVLPESEPGIALLIGEHATRRALYSDWILVHELFHLGFPSFYDEGKWLDEGLATYYEPIIRVRAGLYTERELWNELEEALPQGLAAFTGPGLERADDFRGIYWGGAIACLLADVTARKRQLTRGLEVGLRALREAGGNACEVWSLRDAIATIDRALEAPTLGPIAEQHAAHGAPFDLKALLGELGVGRAADGSIALSNAAPLAAVRRAITSKP